MAKAQLYKARGNTPGVCGPSGGGTLAGTASTAGRCNTPGYEFTTPAAPKSFKDRAPKEQMPPSEGMPIRQHIKMAGGG